MAPDTPRDRLADALGERAGQVVMERGYSLAFVGVHGQVRLFQFRLSKTGFGASRAADDAAFAGLLDAFAALVERLLVERWGGIALRAAFDGEGGLVERLFRAGALERCDAVDAASPVGPLAAPGERLGPQDLLVRASARPVETWGVFELAADDGAAWHVHEPRVRRSLAGG